MKNETHNDLIWWVGLLLICTIIASAAVAGCTDGSRKDVDIGDWGLSKGVHRIQSGECTYVIYSDIERGGIVHAGDCPNPKHKEDHP